MLNNLGIAERQKTITFYNRKTGKGCSKPEPHTSCSHCAIRNISPCAVIQSSELKDFMALSHSMVLPAKHNLFAQGEVATSSYILTTGMARLYKLLTDGRRQIVGFALPGDFLEINLSEHFSVSVDAVTDIEICRFSRQGLLNYVANKPHILQKFFALANNELALAQEQIVMLGCRSAEERIAAFIVGFRGRLRRVGHVSVTLPLMMSRQDIADYLGLTIETVSRTFTKLVKDRRILIVPDGIRILDAKGLEGLAIG